MQLNSFLQPVNSPITSREFIDGYTFDSQNERGAITGIFIRDASINNAKIGTAAIGTANIGTLTFNEISGGTAVLGGTANGDGVLSINNSAGSEVVRGDSDGITVKTLAGTTIIDGSGLVSLANFASDQVSGSGSGTITSETFVDIASGSLSIVLGRTSRVYFSYTLNGYHIDFDGMLVGRLVDGTTQIGPSIQTHGSGPDSGADSPETTSCSFISSLTAGTHTVKLQLRQNNTGGTAFITSGLTSNSFLVNYVVLGS